MNSGSSMAGSYQASCASNVEESTYLKRTRMLHRVRLGLAFVIFVAALAIIGCEAVPLRDYKRTSELEHLWLSLWPLNFDLRPTTALLSCGCVIAFQAAVYIAVAFLPSPHSHIRLLNLLAAAVSVLGFITAVAGVVFAIYLPSSTYPSGFTKNETLQSWTCKWKSLDTRATSSEGTTMQAPSHFSRDCVESRAAFVLLGLLIGLEVLMGVAAGAGFWYERSVTKQRKDAGLELEKVQITALKA